MAGEGAVDLLLPGLAMGAPEPPTASEIADALADADLVVVENLCSLPLNPAASALVAGALAGRPALLHHHDLPWQRPQFDDHPPPPDDRRWRHVTINELSRRELATHGIRATTVYNSFRMPDRGDDSAAGNGGECTRRGGRADEVRNALGIDPDRLLVLQPTRALPRKNVAGGIAVAAALGATYWLLGPAEDGYGPELERLVGSAPCPVLRGMPDLPGGTTVDDAYRACDVVALPSTWEGFGNPSLESVVHRRPLAIGPYPVADELAGFGFRWFPLDRVPDLAGWLAAPDRRLLEDNLAVAAAHFSVADLPDRIAAVIPDH